MSQRPTGPLTRRRLSVCQECFDQLFNLVGIDTEAKPQCPVCKTTTKWLPWAEGKEACLCDDCAEAVACLSGLS